jgi:small subunit ribosomal protein S3
MGQKVTPYANRLGINENWKSRWFFSKFFKVFLEADYVIRKVAREMFARKGVTDVIIERKSFDHCKVIIKTAKPGLVVGKEGQILNKFIQKATEESSKVFQRYNLTPPKIEVEVEEIKKPFTSAQYLAELAAIEIEKGMLARNVMKRVIERARQHKEIKGVKVRLSGRLNSATIHRAEWLSWGRMPLSTLRAVIDYGTATAFCTYGTIGVKVWLYKGERKSYLEENASA